MRFELFAARRLMQSSSGQSSQRVSMLLRLSVAGVALSLSVMLISLAIILGFKEQVSSTAYSQTGHLSLYRWGNSWTTTSQHIYTPDTLIRFLRSRPYVDAAYRLVQQTGMIKTSDAFAGIMLYGIDSLARYPYMGSRLLGGSLSPQEIDTIANPIILPNKTAETLQLEVGDNLRLYFLDRSIRVRAYTLVGTYDAHGLEDLPALCRAESLHRLDKLDSDQYSRVLIMLSPGSDHAATAQRLVSDLSSQGSIILSNSYAVNTAEELMPDLFQWLALLDSNVVFLIVMMLIIGAFTMITGLIIIVLDKTEHIGLLKALGASDTQIRRIFALIAIRLVLWGLLWGNLIALILCYAQYHWHIIGLDPRNYLMDYVPILFDPLLWLGVNLGTLLFIVLSILGPTLIVSHIKPADIMRID